MNEAARTHGSWIAVAAAAVGILAVTLVASVPRSPFYPIIQPGQQAAAPLRWMASVFGLTACSHDALVALSIPIIAAAVAGFLYALREAWRGKLSMRAAFWVAIAFNLLMLAVPLLFSRDVYSYSLYGRIAAVHHGNPYVDLPANYSTDPVFALSGPLWRDTPAVYGPLFTLYASMLARAVGSVGGLIFAFKATAVAASIGVLMLLRRTTERAWPARAVFAVVLFGWNPAILFQTVAGGHNDLLVGLAALGALALLLSRHELAATTVMVLGAAVKASLALPLLLLVVVAVARTDRGARFRIFAERAGIVAGVWLVCAAPFLQLHDPTLGMVNLSTHSGWLAPAKLLGKTLGGWFEPLLGQTGADAIFAGVRVLFLLVLLLVVVFLARDCARRARDLSPEEQGAVWGWSLLALTMTGPVLYPWYLAWTLPIAWTLPRVPRRVAIGASAVLAFAQMPTEPAAPELRWGRLVLHSAHSVIALCVFALLVWLLSDLWRRLHAGLPLGPLQVGEQIAAEADRDGSHGRHRTREPQAEAVEHDPGDDQSRCAEGRS